MSGLRSYISESHSDSRFTEIDLLTGSVEICLELET